MKKPKIRWERPTARKTPANARDKDIVRKCIDA
jgi:hypothetical protein